MTTNLTEKELEIVNDALETCDYSIINLDGNVFHLYSGQKDSIDNWAIHWSKNKTENDPDSVAMVCQLSTAFGTYVGISVGIDVSSSQEILKETALQDALKQKPAPILIYEDYDHTVIHSKDELELARGAVKFAKEFASTIESFVAEINENMRQFGF